MTHQFTLDAAPTAGNLIIVGWRLATIKSNMTLNAAFTTAGVEDDDDLGAFSVGVAYRVAQAGDTATFTFATTSNNSAFSFEIVEVSGMLSPILDKAPAANDPTGTSTTCQTGSTGT